MGISFLQYITLLINGIFQDSVVTIKRNANKANTFKVAEPKDHLECNSGSYSTTTTISINKNDLIPDIREHIPIRPDPARYKYLSLNTIILVAYIRVQKLLLLLYLNVHTKEMYSIYTSHSIRSPVFSS